MLGTNGELRTLLEHIDREVRQHERDIRWGSQPNSTVVGRLGELRGIRRLLLRVLLNRRTEASKKVVDLAVWLNGSGALYETSRHAKGAAAARRPSAPPSPAAG
jgi:hypothetical protein